MMQARAIWRVLALSFWLSVVSTNWSYGAVAFDNAEAHDVEGDTAGAHDATDAHGEAKNMNLLSIDPDLAIVTAIVFLILLAVLGKFAWKPISEALDQREKQIADHLANAERQNEEARKLLADHESKLAATAHEVRQLIDGAKKDAETQKQAILTEAQRAASAEKDRAIKEIDAAKSAALQSMAEKSVDSAVDLAGKIVKRQLSRDDHSEMISQSLKEFPSNN